MLKGFLKTIYLSLISILIVVVFHADAKLPDILLEQKNSVVTIYINDKDGKHIFSGTGFIVAPNGVIATNCLVIAKWLERAENTFDVELQGGVHLPIEDLISSKCENNLALLKVEAKSLPAVKLAADYVPKKEEKIFVISGPLEQGSALSAGIIKSFREKSKVFHISLHVTSEQSGSPIFNMKGEVIGAAVFLPKKGKNFTTGVLLKDIAKQLDTYRKSKTLRKRTIRVTKETESQKIQREIKKPTGDAVDYFSRGCSYDKLKMYREAIEAYQQSIKMNPDFLEAYINLGVDYYELGQYEDAINTYKQALQISPNSITIYNKLGTVYILQGAYASALEAFKKATDIDPRNTDAHFNLGIAYILNGDTVAALREYAVLKDIDKERAESLKDFID